MGQLPPGPSILPHQRSLQGPAGWTHAHQAVGGALRRDAGKAPPSLWLIPSTPLQERHLPECRGFPRTARVSPFPLRGSILTKSRVCVADWVLWLLLRLPRPFWPHPPLHAPPRSSEELCHSPWGLGNPELGCMGLDVRAVGKICIPLGTRGKVWKEGCCVLCRRSRWKPVRGPLGCPCPAL